MNNRRPVLAQRRLHRKLTYPKTPFKLPFKLICSHFTRQCALLPAVTSNPNMGSSLGKAFNHESSDKGLTIEWSMTLLVEHQIQISTIPKIPNPENFALVQPHYHYSIRDLHGNKIPVIQVSTSFNL